ncbi:hypothetical protein [Blastochloris sulfoviridis]|uniref:Uncharacterized protein n=1 Tax=Blastochloris sulfoviridis TaxID=50712 RepID=A0A5M6HKQ7_9HYPH|nr:hypothetical protein [Blastochloris sulfoviridis]KAA5596238.1 hypothetical protein F1193_15810 [Blastochloris sulfoviridis]
MTVESKVEPARRPRNHRIAATLALCALLAFAPQRAAIAGTAGIEIATAAPVLAALRTAADYIRTENVDLAALALERLEATAGADPVATQAREALRALDAGDLAQAGALVGRIGDELAMRRQAAGRPLFADCIRAASRAFAALDSYRNAPPGPATRQAAAATAAALGRCNAEAAPAVAADPDFRRSVDGALASLARIPAAVEAGDGELVYRLLIELKAFDRLLVLRFG